MNEKTEKLQEKTKEWFWFQIRLNFYIAIEFRLVLLPSDEMLVLYFESVGCYVSRANQFISNSK